MICGAQAVIAQQDVDTQTNEITQVRPLLEDADISGAMVTADAPPLISHNENDHSLASPPVTNRTSG